MRQMQIGAYAPLAPAAFPGAPASAVMCQGCPWRCRYCCNPQLLPRMLYSEISWAAVLESIKCSLGAIEAVVFSGGEPTAQRGLPYAIRAVRSLGLKVGLHTAGCYPERLDELLPAVDWVALDFKALPEDYAGLTGVPGSGERVLESLEYLVDSGVAHEVRVTVHNDLLATDKLTRLLDLLAELGANDVVLQPCQAQGMSAPGFDGNKGVANGS